jgi:hypothetical protein
MVHLKFSVNGQTIGTAAAHPESNLTAHYHDYLTLNATSFAALIADTFNGAATPGSENGGTDGSFAGYRAVANANGTITITADTARAGEVLNLEVVAYPSPVVADDTTTGAGGDGTGSGDGSGASGNFTAPRIIASPGAYTGSGTLTWRISSPLDEFIELRCGDRALTRNWYTLASGSTVITFTESYLKSLDAGSYVYQAIFKGGSVDLALVIPAAQDAGSDKLGDTVNNSTTNNTTTNNTTTNNTSTNPPANYYYYNTSTTQTGSGASDQVTTDNVEKDATQEVLSTPATRTNVPTLTGDGTATASTDLAGAQTPTAGFGADAGLQSLVFVIFGVIGILLGVCGFFVGVFVSQRKRVQG